MATSKPRKTPKPRFVVLGGKVVHVVHTELWDRKNSQCMTVRKKVVAGQVPGGSMSPEAALALDECKRCGTHAVAQAALPPEAKAAARKDAKDKVMDSLKSKPKGKGKSTKAAKAPKEAKPKKKSMTKSGPRSTGSDTKGKAEALAAFGKEHGWKVKVEPDGDHMAVIAVKGNETIKAFFIDGKYDTARHAFTQVGDWTGKLRGAHGCRRQMAGEGRDRVHPSPGKGRGGPRGKRAKDEPEDESADDAKHNLPFALDDDEAVILDHLKGKIIRWRNGTTKAVEEAWLPPEIKGRKRDVISMTAHPKTGRRMVSFLTVESINENGPNYGPERNVYLDRIIRVVAS